MLNIADLNIMQACGVLLSFVITECPISAPQGFVFQGQFCNYLILLVGPLGLEPRTNGL